ncbi:MAG: class I SAM-dependent methyltransferase [Verrucomicrobia bacterium]|nr:class I SAM-dependent methyltransferase [Verrucomicrobiota bacterium]
MSTNRTDQTMARNRDVLLTCRNSQGMGIRSTPVRLTRFDVVFEVYNPFSILQLSEVLNDFRITIGERLVYSGRATVSNLVNAGIMLLCEATLNDAWLDVDLFSPVSQRERLAGELEAFLHEANKARLIEPEFKVVVADMQTWLADLRRWLEQLELGIRSIPAGDRATHEREVIEQLHRPVVGETTELFTRFERIANNLPTEALPMHRTYMRRQLHPLVLCAPFPYRTYHKPLGYAGDYEMVNMILGDPLQGASLFAKTVNLWFLNQAPSVAHRNRITYLLENLVAETRRVAAQGRRARILNLGCGPAGEVQRFLRDHEVSSEADFLLWDFNPETLDYARTQLEGARARHGRRTELRFEQKSVHQLLRDAGRPMPDTPRYDLVYCAGLFDYLSDRICQRLVNILYGFVAPGGLLIATNVDPSNPMRHGMEFLLEWHLIYRDQAQMRQLHPTGVAPACIATKSDDTGVNIYLEVRKPAGG